MQMALSAIQILPKSLIILISCLLTAIYCHLP